MDGGRSAAQWFLYQYLRTLEALLDAMDEELVGAVHVEGRRGAADEPAAEGVDYELTDHAGRTLLAVQVKGRGPSGKFRATDLFRAVSKLVHDRDAPSYQVIVSAAPGESADAFIAAIREAANAEDLRHRLDRVLSSARASRARASLQSLPDRDLDRMRRVDAVIDRREDEEIREILHARLRSYRNTNRAGLGDESAGLMTGYLISEIFRSAADAGRAEFTIAEFRSMLLVNGATLRSALGYRDWGVVIGTVPAWPDIYRGEAIERISSALPCRNDSVDVRRCALVGMSGIGKSSIAAGYILDRADLYDVIYWVDAENDPSLHLSFTRVLAHLTGEHDDAAADSAWLRSRVHSLLARSAGRWLMVFDNCTEPRSAEQWIPRAGNGHVIVTSTDSAQSTGAGAKVDVGPMSPGEAVTLLKNRLHVHGDPAGDVYALLTRLADAMERWPLALELAAAYLDAGMGIGGILDYLATLKVRSLDDRRSRPPGYPRTLVEAVYLCLERIEGQSQRLDDPAGVAASAIWFAAYMSGRRIPAHLLVTCVLMDPETAGGFRAASPVYMNAAVCPSPEVVAFLRSESLVNFDEPLPAEGLTEPGLPGATVSVNAVLQEVLRDQRDADPRVGEHLLGRVAYHVNLWMAKAHEYADFPRMLAFAAHATAIEQHAARLGVGNDYIAYLRGNLAGVLQRRGDHAKAEALLRKEIAFLDGRAEEHCIVGCCQARIMLAQTLADKEPPAAAEILELLGHAYPVLQARSVTGPSLVTEIAISVQQVLRRTLTPHWGLDGHLTHSLSQLEAVVADLIRHMPEDSITAAVRILEEAENALREDPQVTISLCRRVLGQDWDDTRELRVRQIRQDAQRLIIEAQVYLEDYAGAGWELPAFLSMTEPAEPYAVVREKLVHNAGRAVAFAWLTTDQAAPELTRLLQMMTGPELLEPIKTAFPGRTAARMRLLQAVRALADGDEQTASAHLGAARISLQPGSAVSPRDLAWTGLKTLIAAALEGDESAAGRSPQRQDRPWSGSDLRRFIAPDLLGRGLPGPSGTWLRRPHPGEADMVNGLLNHADDALEPWAAEAIDSGTLSSIHHGAFYGRSLDELAGELSQGGPDTVMSGLTIVLVAVDPSRRLVGAIQMAPPFKLLTSIREMPRQQMLAATHVMMKITGVGVVPSRRGAGIGRALTRSAADLAWRIGYRVVYGQFAISSGLDKFFASCGFDIASPSDGITFIPYDMPFGVMPQAGNQFFASRYDEGMSP
jgi:GNAT superfamily N-acetyltransferase